MNGRMQPLGFTLEQLKEVVKTDTKQRFMLVYEPKDGTSVAYSTVAGEGDGQGVWLIRANQGHSMKVSKA
jgi:2'-phosphotransferase